MSADPPSLRTRLGHAGWHDHEVRGVVVFDLDPRQTSFLELALLAVGVSTTEQARAVLTACVQAGFNPDPRIPPMKLIRLGSSCGGQLMGLATAFAGLQGAYVGMSAVTQAALFLRECRLTLGEDFDDDDIDAMLLRLRRARRGLPGFGVPGRPIDERIVWLSSKLGEIVDAPRPWWQLFERIGARISLLRRQPNLGGGLAAALLDLGCDPHQVGALSSVFGFLPLLGNAIEGAMQAPELLRCLPPSSSIEYLGQAPRISPRAAQHDPGGDEPPDSACDPA